MKKALKLLICTLAMLLTIIYIVYRICFTIPTKLGILSIILAIIVLLVEIWESFDFFIYYLNILIVDKKNPKVSSITDLDSLPDIDIFIATYNESEEILTRTIEACLNMKYPDSNKVHIYICDDGNRKEIMKLSKKYKINYITRNSRKDAKAGNYNNALSKTSSPFIATFDADMAPTEDFLMTTVPYIFGEENKSVGFIQLPQSFINPDIFQYRFRLEDKIPFEQEYFYHSIQLAKNKTNSVVFCGTNTLFRREALESTKGFATGTISEDIATGMLIEARGFKGVAIDHIGAYGVSVEDFNGFAKQRSRWARGCVQMFKKYGIFPNQGLSVRQKLEYWSCVSYWFFGLRRFIYLIAPLLFSIFGIIIVDCNLLTFIAIWLPSYIIKRLALDLLEENRRSSTWNKIYETIMTPILALSVLKEYIGLGSTIFEVTSKDKSKFVMDKSNKKVLVWHMVFFILNMIGFGISAYRLYNKEIYTYILSFIWTLSNMCYLFIAIIFDLRYKEYKYKDFEPNKVKRYTKRSLFQIFINKKKRNV